MGHAALFAAPSNRTCAMTGLFAPVVSIAATKRRRFVWAAWWTEPPSMRPFAKPDAAGGGARSREEALQAAQKAAGRPLKLIEPQWAASWARILRGDSPLPPRTAPEAARVIAPPPEGSVAWARRVLQVPPNATAEDLKRAFRARALETHPDRGGEDASFIQSKRAYDVAIARALRTAKRTRRKSGPSGAE